MVWLSSRWKLVTMIAPALVVYTVYVVYPVFYSLFYSLTDFRGFGSTRFVGTQNYEALVADRLFWTALTNTGIILVLSLVILIPAAFGLALLFSINIRGTGAMRALAFAPNILAPILVGLVWVFILDPQLGMVNTLLAALGVDWQPQWIGGRTMTPYSVALVHIWATVGFSMTIFYAGLRLLPHEVLEASAIDGASRLQQLRYVVIPMMRNSFAINVVLVITGVFKIFELVYQLTGGGPVHLSEVLVSYMYYVTFVLQRYGPGMALAVIITVLGAIAALSYLLVFRRRGEDA